jgi:Winged helix-turn helix
MEEERIELSTRERERLKVLHEVEQGHLRQMDAARRLRLSDRQVRRLLGRLGTVGDGGLVHGLRGRPSNRKIPEGIEQRSLRRLRLPAYAGFGPTLASEHLAQHGLGVSRETLRKWMSAAGLWQTRRRRAKQVHVWRPRRSSFGELVMMDSSPFRWLEERGPACHLIALIDDATSRVWGRFVEHDSSEENLRTLGGWLERYGRPLALYTDKNGLFVTSRPVQWQEQLRDTPARTQFGRALGELDIEWIAAQTPQAKGRIERLFSTLQDRLVKEMRLAEISTLQQANRFLEITFWPFWDQRFAVPAAQNSDAHRSLQRAQRLEQILSVRVARTVASDHTVSWDGQRWGLRREEVCAGLRGARAEIERRLDGTHWLRFRGRYLPLSPCPNASRPASPSGLRPPGLAGQNPKLPNRIKTKYSPPADHPWRKPWKRTFLSCKKPDISTLR